MKPRFGSMSKYDHIVGNLSLNGEISERFQRARAERRSPTRRRSEENEERRVLPRIL
jgi:tRNA(Glu) U13 pseudouridine synthase TruD